MIRRSKRDKKMPIIYEPVEDIKKTRRKGPKTVAEEFLCTICQATRWCRTGRCLPKSGPCTVINERGELERLCRSCTVKVKKQTRLSNHDPGESTSTTCKKDHLEKAASVAGQLAKQLGCNDPTTPLLLYCTYYKKNACKCVEHFIDGDLERAYQIVQLHRQAVIYSKLKYENIDPSRKKGRPGLGNGQKKSLRFTEFVKKQRTILKEERKLCERSVQRILCYSNNFLHKRLKTESNACRQERSKGLAALGLLFPLQDLSKEKCCPDQCSKMARTHENLVAGWRREAGRGQAGARRVLSEMLTPSGGRMNCHQFITMVTGCAVATIEKVRATLVGGDDIPRSSNDESENESSCDLANDRELSHGVVDAQRKSSTAQIWQYPDMTDRNHVLPVDVSGHDEDVVEACRISPSPSFHGSGSIDTRTEPEREIESSASAGLLPWNSQGSAFRVIRPNQTRSDGNFQDGNSTPEVDHHIIKSQPHCALLRHDSKGDHTTWSTNDAQNRSGIPEQLTLISRRKNVTSSPTKGFNASFQLGVPFQAFVVPKRVRQRPLSHPKFSENKKSVLDVISRGSDSETESSKRSRSRHVSLPSKAPQTPHAHSGMPDVRSALRPLPSYVIRPILFPPLNQPLNPSLVFSPEGFVPLRTESNPGCLMSPIFEPGEGERRLPYRPESTLDREGTVISGRESDWSRFLDAGK